MLSDDTFVTGSNDKTVKIWNLQTNQVIADCTFKTDVTALSSLQRSDGSSMILVGLFRSFAVLNQSYEIYKTFEGEHEGSINCILGLRDGETVLTASSDNKIV